MTLEKRLEQIGGCGDGNCKVHVRGGQHTNGGCKCFRNDPLKAERVISAHKEEIRRLQAALTAERTRTLEAATRANDAFDLYVNIAKDLSAELEAERALSDRMREANGILEDALQEVGDDYPGSSCQEWCQQQVKAARAALQGDTE